MRRQHGLIFAGMGLGRDQERPRPNLGFQRLKRGSVKGQRRRIGFQAAHHPHMGRAKAGKAGGDFLVLRQHHIKGADQAAGGAGKALPAFGRMFGNPRIDQGQPHPARRRFQNQIRPQIGFHKQPGIRFPVIQKSGHGARDIERHELMDGAGGQALAQDFCAGDGAAGHQHGVAAGLKFFNQRQRGQAFADTGAVNPDQASARAGDPRNPQPFAQPVMIFLAAPGPPRQQQ